MQKLSTIEAAKVVEKVVEKIVEVPVKVEVEKVVTLEKPAAPNAFAEKFKELYVKEAQLELNYWKTHLSLQDIKKQWNEVYITRKSYDPILISLFPEYISPEYDLDKLESVIPGLKKIVEDMNKLLEPLPDEFYKKHFPEVEPVV